MEKVWIWIVRKNLVALVFIAIGILGGLAISIAWYAGPLVEAFDKRTHGFVGPMILVAMIIIAILWYRKIFPKKEK